MSRVVADVKISSLCFTRLHTPLDPVLVQFFRFSGNSPSPGFTEVPRGSPMLRQAQVMELHLLSVFVRCSIVVSSLLAFSRLFHKSEKEAKLFLSVRLTTCRNTINQVGVGDNRTWFCIDFFPSLTARHAFVLVGLRLFMLFFFSYLLSCNRQ